MMLQMYINTILIDAAEMDFRFCDTIKKKEEQVEDMQAFLYKQNFDKAFIAHLEPTYYLTASSKANQIIEDDIDNKLVRELEEELKIKRAKTIY